MSDELSQSHRDRIDDIRGRIDGLAEELTDVGLDMLREAVDQGATKRPVADKALASARRALEKASRSLDV